MSVNDRIGNERDQHLDDLVARLREQDGSRKELVSSIDTFLTEFDAELSNALDQTFDDRAAAIDWLLTPTHALRARPIEMLKGNERRVVLEELGRIAHGDLA